MVAAISMLRDISVTCRIITYITEGLFSSAPPFESAEGERHSKKIGPLVNQGPVRCEGQ
ncbi:hypothetical protein AGR7A_pAt20033 [Agrobacterium deltaense NCPPB 1641]|uniref:Uncharacterized protein n=1 Tax=Agrobacterium deltaense NCPPB 1641 TaxID=1183425 RepID=A0A1S7U7X5_9HYPH|nr:hypothetical protein AGR7A_pAt20033 [Agrobacterium deltaense NCPPB 1641]